MAIRCVVLDFDGTFTDIETEAVPFEPAFQAALADLLGRDLREEWAEERARILARPENFGWEYDGKIVAPATADPYLLSTATVQALLDRAAILRNPANRTAVSQALYGLAYDRTLTALKREAKLVLDELLGRELHVVVVTNSKGDAVGKKLDELALPERARLGVRGEAKKFWVTEPAPSDSTFARLAQFERAESLARPIYLRRDKYYEALREIWKASGATAAETLVCGDIYELDLALPAALGAQIALVERSNTLAYERAATAAHAGKVIKKLTELLPIVDGNRVRARAKRR